MGLPVAKLFIQNGYSVLGSDRDQLQLDKFLEFGGKTASDVKTIAQNVNTTIIFVLNGEQIETVVGGKNGLLAGTGESNSIICMSTISKEQNERVATQCVKRNVAFLDCPCTGGPARAEIGSLTLIAAAKKSILERCRPLLEVLDTIVTVGENPGISYSRDGDGGNSDGQKVRLG